jgi:hypothetical protein
MSDNPYRPPQARDEIRLPSEPLVFAGTPESRNSGPSGLGGWLILVAIALLVTPLKLGFLLGTTFLPLLTDGTLQALTTPGSEHYHPFWLPLIAFEVAANSIMLLGSIGLAALFFMKSRRFPKLYIAFLVVNLAILVIDEILGSRIPLLASSDDLTSMKELSRAVFSCCLWVPYMMVSKRVKNTFA